MAGETCIGLGGVLERGGGGGVGDAGPLAGGSGICSGGGLYAGTWSAGSSASTVSARRLSSGSSVFLLTKSKWYGSQTPFSRNWMVSGEAGSWK